MSARRGIIVLLLASVAAISCRSYEDITARYTLERKLWDAQVHERKININFLRASQRDLFLAIQAFNDVVSYDPLAGRSTERWDPVVVQDIKRIQIVSKIALANLYFLSEQYYDAGDFYARTLKESELSFEKSLDVRLNLARTLFLAGESQSLEVNCARIFKDIVESDYFWAGQSALKDVFLNIPIVLARIYRDRGDEAKYDEYCGLAQDFYGNIMSTWPDSLMAARARFSLANVYLVREEWEPALREIDLLIDHPNFRERSGNLLLLKGEILAYAMDKPAVGSLVFREIVREHPGSPSAQAAGLNLATITLTRGDEEAGLRMLKEIEDSGTSAPEITAKAMLARALHLESRDRWDEAIVILRRIIRLYPHTESAIEAPLVITKHNVAKGEKRLAELSLDRAKEFYLSLISQNSKYTGNRLDVENYLIENYLILGRAAEVATLLETESKDWDDMTTAGGLFKSALIYSEVLDDRVNAERILKKCIELFPETRYAKIAQRQLEYLAERKQE